MLFNDTVLLKEREREGLKKKKQKEKHYPCWFRVMVSNAKLNLASQPHFVNTDIS